MPANRKSRIVRAFDRADGYDAHARVQRVAAARLAAHIERLEIDPSLPALEIGCGTGFLTQRLRAPRLLATDIAPAMVERARARIPTRPELSFAVLDGEQPGTAPHGRYGLIASNLAFQWFADLPAAVSRLAALLAPGGRLVFTNPFRMESPQPSLRLDSRQVVDLGGFECRLEMYRKLAR